MVVGGTCINWSVSHASCAWRSHRAPESTKRARPGHWRQQTDALNLGDSFDPSPPHPHPPFPLFSPSFFSFLWPAVAIMPSTTCTQCRMCEDDLPGRCQIRSLKICKHTADAATESACGIRTNQKKVGLGEIVLSVDRPSASVGDERGGPGGCMAPGLVRMRAVVGKHMWGFKPQNPEPRMICPISGHPCTTGSLETTGSGGSDPPDQTHPRRRLPARATCTLAAKRRFVGTQLMHEPCTTQPPF